MGEWINMFFILVCGVVIIFGFLLFFGDISFFENNRERKWREIEFKVIDIMVCFMGIIGFIFWFMKVFYCGFWVL